LSSTTWKKKGEEGEEEEVTLRGVLHGGRPFSPFSGEKGEGRRRRRR